MVLFNHFIARKIAFVTALTTLLIMYISGIISNSPGTEKWQRESLLSRELRAKTKFTTLVDRELDDLASEKVTGSKSQIYIRTLAPESSRSTTISRSTNLGCDHLNALLEEAKHTPRATFRRENKDGNRGIYFTEIKDESLQNIPIVIKVATIQNATDPIEQYRYNSALRELINLQRLHDINFVGAPDVWGACVQPLQVIYAATRFKNSHPLCTGNGTDISCAMAQNVIRSLSGTKQPKQQALQFLEKVACFFAQFEKHRLFMEDFSGTNFHFSPSTWDLFLVDADSVIFYESAPILSRMSCHTNADCPKPSGNLWPAHALNRKIYYGCNEMYGVCVNSTCQGIGSSLHTCGVGRWLITAIRSIVPVEVYNDYSQVKHCTSESNPERRCSLISVCSKARLIIEKYWRLKKS